MTPESYLSVQCTEGRCHACRPLDWACTHKCHVTAEVASRVSEEGAEPQPATKREHATETLDGAAAPCDTERDGRVVPLRGNTPGDAAAQKTQLRPTGST